MLALISNPSTITDTRSVNTFSRQTVLVTRFSRGGMSEEHKVKQNVDHQVSVDPPQIVIGDQFGSVKTEFCVTFHLWIHFSRSIEPVWPVSLLWWKASATQAVSITTKIHSGLSPAYSLSVMHIQIKA